MALPHEGGFIPRSCQTSLHSCVHSHMLVSKTSSPHVEVHIWLLMSEWDVVRWGYKNGYQEEMFEKNWTMCSKYGNHFGFHMQHNQGNLCDHLLSTNIFTLVIYKIFKWAPNCIGKWLYGLRCGFVNHLVQIMCFIAEEKRANIK